MPSLIDLPTELLALVCQELGGRELRRGHGAARLTVCRKWYHVARPVYLTGLELSDVRIYGSTTDQLEGQFSYAGRRRLMHKNTRGLRLRLLGHWWDTNTAQQMEHSLQNGSAIDPLQSNGHNHPLVPLLTREGETALKTWRRDELKPRLDELFGDLRHFHVLENLVIEASAESSMDPEITPRWNYIYHSTVYQLAHNIPLAHDLASLTLDLCGTNLVDEDESSHLCEALARIVPHIEHVRLRLRSICPTVLRMKDSSTLSPRIKTLVLKLHLPLFHDSVNLWASPCSQSSGSRHGGRLIRNMARASQSFLAGLAMTRSRQHGQSSRSETQQSGAELPTVQFPVVADASTNGTSHDKACEPICHGMSGFRITYCDMTSPSLSTLDCLTMRRLYCAGEFFAHEDEGLPCWFELASDGRPLLDGGPFIFTHV